MLASSSSSSPFILILISSSFSFISTSLLSTNIPDNRINNDFSIVFEEPVKTTTIAQKPDADDLKIATEEPTITTTELPNDLDNFININDNYCGHRSIRMPKIINGTDAVHGHYPWMISLMLNNRHHCGGSLINENWILTAAHCVFMVEPHRFKVKLGGHFRNKYEEPTSIIINKLKTIPHPGFTFATFADDVALIRLPKKIKYTNYIRPICLPNRISDRLEHDRAMVIGWGKIKQGGFSADVLQEVELPIVDNIKCTMWYREMGKMLSIRQTQICAGLEEGGKDACQGDSGSPMLIIDQQNRRATVIGIVSAGIGCALPKLPGVYTRVSSYLKWIQETMEKYDREAAMKEHIYITTTAPDVNSNSWTTTTTSHPPLSTPSITTTMINEVQPIETTTNLPLMDNTDSSFIITELPPGVDHQIIFEESTNGSSVPPPQTTTSSPVTTILVDVEDPLLEDQSDQTKPIEHNNLLDLITGSHPK